MDIPKIVTAGADILKIESGPIIKFNTKELNELVALLFEAMKYYNGVGISAPQIGVAKRVFVYGFEQSKRYPDVGLIAKTVVINPKIVWFSKEKTVYYEGCLSLPNIRGEVERSNEIEIIYYLSDGQKVQRQVQGFEARIIQHELDHLDGILFPSRMNDLSTLVYQEIA